MRISRAASAKSLMLSNGSARATPNRRGLGTRWITMRVATAAGVVMAAGAPRSSLGFAGHCSTASAILSNQALTLWSMSPTDSHLKVGRYAQRATHFLSTDRQLTTHQNLPVVGSLDNLIGSQEQRLRDRQA